MQSSAFLLNPLELTGRASTHVVPVGDGSRAAHPAAATAFMALQAAAARDGIDLRIESAYRNFNAQLDIWNSKFQGKRPLYDAEGRVLDPATLSDEHRIEAILCWSALPGASRHHWGTEFDVVDCASMPPGYQTRLLPDEFSAGGVFESLGHWLAQHAADFGFYRPYDRYRGGFHPEPWHLSYWPISAQLLPALTVAVLREALEQNTILGIEHVLPALDTIHASYISLVAPPPVHVDAPGYENKHG